MDPDYFGLKLKSKDEDTSSLEKTDELDSLSEQSDLDEQNEEGEESAVDEPVVKSENLNSIEDIRKSIGFQDDFDIEMDELMNDDLIEKDTTSEEENETNSVLSKKRKLDTEKDETPVKPKSKSRSRLNTKVITDMKKQQHAVSANVATAPLLRLIKQELKNNMSSMVRKACDKGETSGIYISSGAKERIKELCLQELEDFTSQVQIATEANGRRNPNKADIFLGKRLHYGSSLPPPCRQSVAQRYRGMPKSALINIAQQSRQRGNMLVQLGYLTEDELQNALAKEEQNYRRRKANAIYKRKQKELKLRKQQEEEGKHRNKRVKNGLITDH